MVLICDVSATELNVRPHLVSIFEELSGVFCLKDEVVRVRVWTESHFFHRDRVRLLAGLFLFLLLLVSKLPVINNFANGRTCSGGNFNEVQSSGRGAA